MRQASGIFANEEREWLKSKHQTRGDWGDGVGRNLNLAVDAQAWLMLVQVGFALVVKRHRTK